MESILNSIKKLLGIDADYIHFDLDIIMYINSALMALNQLGVGPVNGYSIMGTEETWEDYIGLDSNLEAVKAYIYLKVRLIFDPPSNAFIVTAFENQLKEYEWRLNIQAEPVEEETEETEETEEGGLT